MHREERTMTTIYLIRHAEAEGNVFRRIHGQYDSCVTPNGRRQIAALAQRFAGIPVDAVYASDLKRTCLTATAIYRQKGLPLHRDARFREVGLGRGRTRRLASWSDVIPRSCTPSLTIPTIGMWRARSASCNMHTASLPGWTTSSAVTKGSPSPFSLTAWSCAAR